MQKYKATELYRCKKLFTELLRDFSLFELRARNNLNKQLLRCQSLTVNVFVVYVPIIHEITAK